MPRHSPWPDSLKKYRDSNDGDSYRSRRGADPESRSGPRDQRGEVPERDTQTGLFTTTTDEETTTTPMMIADRGGMGTGTAGTWADTMRARTRTTAPRSARRKWSGTAIEIEASAAIVATTSAWILRIAALRPLDVPVRILALVPTPETAIATSRARNRPLRRLHPRTKGSPTLPRRACSPLRRTWP
jgi:hypothetical protein